MTRVATFAMHGRLFASIAQSQERLAETQLQMSTEKRVRDYAGLGTSATATLSARTLLSRSDAFKQVGDRTGATLALYDAHLSSVEEGMTRLKTKMLEAIGTGRTSGLQGAAEEAFATFRIAMNAEEAGTPLFAGSQTDRAPFTPARLADSAGLPAANAFAGDTVKTVARIAEGRDMTVGISASEVGGDMFAAFRTLAEAGTLGDTPTPAQLDALKVVVGQLGKGLETLRSAWVENGRKQAELERTGAAAQERSLILQEMVSRNEDADMAQVASELTLRQTALEASYSVFARLSGLSLVNFLPR